MKRFLMLAALGYLGLCPTTAQSQSRDLGAQRLILDDGAGGRLTIEYAGPGPGTLILPDGGGSVTPSGSTLNSTLRWDGTEWLENAAVLSSATGTVTLSGNLALPSTTATAGQITVNGQRFMHSKTGGAFLGTNAGNLTTTGTNNTGIGTSALTALTIGSDNTAVGVWSLRANLDAVLNTAIGAYSMASTTSGSRNAGIGTYTLVLNTTGESNTAVGNSALRMNVSGNGNTAVGAQALDLSTTSFNTAVGRNSLASLTTGSMNTAMGQNSGVSDPTFSNTTAIGFAAVATANDQVMLGNTGVTQVTTAGAINAGTGFTVAGLAPAGEYLRGNGTRFVSGAIQAADLPTGSGSYINNTTTAQTADFNITGDGTIGDDLTVSGIIALPATTATEGQITIGGAPFMHAYNVGTFVGVSAGNLTLGGSGTVGIGRSALASQGVAHYNTAVGDYSLTNTTTGGSNTAIGYQALTWNTIGELNTAVGIGASALNTSGNRNTAVGTSALQENLVGEDNTAVGMSALYGATGSENTGLGYNAATQTTGNGNTAVGYTSMMSLTSGSDNTAIGHRTDVTDPTVTNVTLLGAGATTATSNTVVLGNTSVTEVLTTGNINAPSVRILSLNLAAGADRFADKYLLWGGAAFEVINNTIVTGSSIIVATLESSDNTVFVTGVVPTAGSFTVYFNAATPVFSILNYIIVNP